MVDWSAYPLSLGKLHDSVTRVHPGDGWDYEWKRLKLVGRGLLFGPWNVRWQAYLKNSFMSPFAQILPQLYLKVQLPYLNRNYLAERRLEILQNHYDFMRDRVSKKLCHRLVIDAPIRLARWSTTTGDFSLLLDFPKRFWQEGELEISLYHEATGRVFAFIHFTVSGPSEISIGCMQGGKPVTDPTQVSNQKLFSAFRRDMHGLRHKGFLVQAVRSIAQAWSIHSVRAVSADAQIWSAKILADYNRFWTEEGGVLAADGMFELPLDSTSKGSRAKAMYQRRDQCLEVITREVTESLAQPWRIIDTLDVSFEKEKPPDKEA
jgi:uncharacterized protein VirK/YbjX